MKTKSTRAIPRNHAPLRTTALGGLFAILTAATPAAAITIIDGDTTITVPGASSPYPWGNFGNLTDLTGLGSSDSQLYVGNTGGSAWLGITSGGEMRNSTAYIGYGAGSTGAVLVDGTGIWKN
ncbi:MAG: hypothetical protein FWC49_00685, partial [Proteobacteria bacterium]|nr:hypothetical protein [Pseudomonadota bacterium]